MEFIELTNYLEMDLLTDLPHTHYLCGGDVVIISCLLLLY
jgi:hypothetical protein